MRYELIQDTDAPNPRLEFDNTATLSTWHRRYALGEDKNGTALREVLGDYDSEPGELGAIAEAKGMYILPVYLYDHSGLTVSTRRFSCPWDSGQVGWIWMTKDTAREEGITEPYKLLEAEIEELDQYLRGDVWGYVVYDDDDNIIDSLWGLYGEEHAHDEAEQACV